VVTDLDIDRNELASLIAASRAHGDDLALLRLLLDGVWMMMPPADFSSASMRLTTTRS
jgi:hypothetical protein